MHADYSRIGDLAWFSLEESSWFVCHFLARVIILDAHPIQIAYIFAQLMGGIVGAAIVYGNYFHAIDLVEGGHGVRTLKTAGLFSTYPVSLFPQSIQDYRADLFLSSWII